MWEAAEDTEAAAASLKKLTVVKPTPMPRKVCKNNATDKEESLGEIYANVNRKPIPMEGESLLRRGSNSFHKIERSLRNMIPKRKSAIADSNSSPILCDDLQSKSLSLPSENIFDKISFGSPFEGLPLKIGESANEDDGSDQEMCCSSDTPPSYPPPPLPDESIYDELSSASSYHFSGSDSNSIYEELSKYMSSPAETPLPVSCSVSASSNYADASSCSGSRYEEIKGVDEPEVLIPTTASNVDIRRKGDMGAPYRVTNTVIMEFDPLVNHGAETLSCDEAWTRLCSSSASSLTNPFHDSVIMSFLADDEDHATYGTIFKKHDSISSECAKLNFEMPKLTGAPPVPPRRFDSGITQTDSVNTDSNLTNSQTANRTSIMRWSSMKKVARRVAESVENKVRRESINKKFSSEEKIDKNEEGGSRLSAVSSGTEPEEVYIPLVLHHSGVLYRSGGGKRWGVLAQRKLTQFASKDSPDVKETVDVDQILSLQLCTDNKIR